VVHSWGGVATNTAKSGQNVMKMVEFSPIHHQKYFFRIKKVVAVDLWSVWTVRSGHILLGVIFHYSCCTMLQAPQRQKIRDFETASPKYLFPTELTRFLR
jgi:hypothetical protein